LKKAKLTDNESNDVQMEAINKEQRWAGLLQVFAQLEQEM
jgi:hypothetical protein